MDVGQGENGGTSRDYMKSWNFSFDPQDRKFEKVTEHASESSNLIRFLKNLLFIILL